MDNVVLPVFQSGVLLYKITKVTAVIAIFCVFFLFIRPITVKSLVYQAFREVTERRMLWETRDLEEIQSRHFIVRYQPEDDDVADMVLETAEKSFQPVSSNFGKVVEDKILIVIYPTRESLGKSFGWAADESAMGVYWAGVIRILSPSAWIDEDNRADVKLIFETQGPIAHELAHLMVDYCTGGNYSRWFTEGVAQYIEVRAAGIVLEKRAVTHPGELYPLTSMDREFDNLMDQSLAYYESFLAVDYLVNNFGEESLTSILVRLGRGYSMEAAFQSETALTLGQFEENFKKWAVERA